MKFISAVSAFLLSAVLAHAQTYYWNRDPAMSGTGSLSKAYNWSSLQNGQGNPPASTNDDNFDGPVPDPKPAWTFLDSDGVANSGKAEISPEGKLLISGQGKDLTAKDPNNPWRFFTAVHRKDIKGVFDVTKGVFDVTVKLEGEVAVSDWTKAGIIIANNLDNMNQGGVALVARTPMNGVIFEYTDAGTASGQITKTIYTSHLVVPMPVWLRLVRGATQISAWYRTDTTVAWTQVGAATTTVGLNSTIDSDVGLFTTSVDSVGKTPQTTTATFDDFRGSGDIASPNLDLRFDGTGTLANNSASMAGDFPAGSMDFTGYTGTFLFNSWTLSVARDLRFNASMPVNAGTGKIVFTGDAGSATFLTKTNGALPPLRKTGAGKLVLSGGVLSAPSLRVEAGALDFNNNGADLGGFVSTGGSLEGLGADDSLIVTGDADFSGLSAVNLPLGNVMIKSMGSAVTSYFNPGGKTFPKVTLSTWATGTGGVTLVTGPGSLTAANGLVFRNHGAATGFDGVLDFHTQNPSVTSGGDFLQVQDGSGSNKQVIRLGNGIWSIDGNTSFSLAGGGSGDSAAFRFTKASGIQTLSVGGGALFSVEHASAGTLRLGTTLSATHFRQADGGAFDFNGFNLALKGNLKVENGVAGTLLNLQGRTLTVEGNASFAGKSMTELLGLKPTAAWILKVTGTLTADSADIANSDASGGSKGVASKGCVNSLGNKNWEFWVPPQPPTITREPTDVIAKPGWKVSFSLHAGGSSPLAYEWRRQGDTLVLSRDTLLLLDTVTEAQDNSHFFCVVSNALGKDTSVQALLSVRACDSAYAPPGNLTAVEGSKVTLKGKTGCASEVVWVPVSGPIPRLLDPQVDTLVFTAPRVKGDSLLVLQFNARFGSNWESKTVTVTVKDSIPDPAVSLAAQPSWDGTAYRVVKSVIGNQAALAKFPTYPLRYLWAVSPMIVDTTAGGDSLVLLNPIEDGNVEVTLCADNGGSPSCAKTVLEINRLSSSVLRGRLRAGPVWLAGSRLVWNAPGLARVVDWQGRVLWQSWGVQGFSAQLPAAAERSMAVRAARMEFLTPAKKR
ncbi:MAG: hypothetical protein JWO30_585 [Fibrobacteres bacterium]|nr:hypothetical protein [Fibrobacterota bacterium]